MATKNIGVYTIIKMVHHISSNKTDVSVKLAIVISAFVFTIALLVITIFKKDNPVNKLTLMPYCAILVQEFLAISFYACAMFEIDGYKGDRLHDCLVNVMDVLWFTIVLLTSLMYVLITELIDF